MAPHDSLFDGEFTRIWRRHGHGPLVPKTDFMHEEDLQSQPELPDSLQSLLSEPSSTDVEATNCFRLKPAPLSTPAALEPQMETQPARVLQSEARFDASVLVAAATMTQSNRVSSHAARVGGTAMRSATPATQPNRLDPLVVRVIGAMLFLHIVEAVILIILVMKR